MVGGELMFRIEGSRGARSSREDVRLARNFRQSCAPEGGFLKLGHMLTFAQKDFLSHPCSRIFRPRSHTMESNKSLQGPLDQ